MMFSFGLIYLDYSLLIRLRYSSAALQLSSALQITFEAGIPWTGEGRRENYLSVKPTYSSAHQVLGKFLLEHSWKQVVVIYEETMPHKLVRVLSDLHRSDFFHTERFIKF